MPCVGRQGCHHASGFKPDRLTLANRPTDPPTSRGPALRALLASVVLSLAVGQPHAQLTLEIERESGRVESLPMTSTGEGSASGPASAPGIVSPGPDERGVWYHLHRGDIDMMNVELQRLEAMHPGWVPQGDLARAVADALRAPDPSEVPPSLSTELPEAAPPVDPCDDPVAAWRDARGARAVLEPMLARCQDQGVARGTLAEMLRRRSLAGQLALVEDLSERRLNRVARQVVAERLYALSFEALADGSFILAPAKLDGLQREVVRREDGDAALLLGWRAMDRKDAGDALAWFERAGKWGREVSARDGLAAAHALRARIAIIETGDLASGVAAIDASREAGGDPAEGIAWALYDRQRWQDAEQVFRLVPDPETAALGRALAMQAAGDVDQAMLLACGPGALSLRLAGLCTELMVAAFFRAWETGDAADTIRLGLRIENRDAPVPAAVAEIMAWAHLEMGDHDEAARRFERLVGPAMSADLAPGVISSFQFAGRHGEIDRLGRDSPALAERLREQRAALAASRGQHDLHAALTEPGRGATRQWTLNTGFDVSRSRGTRGLDRAELDRAYLGLSSVRDGSRIDVGLRRTGFAAGSPAADAPLGFRGLKGAMDAYRPHDSTTTDELMMRARLERPDYTLEGEIGTGPRGGPVDASPSFGVSATHHGKNSTTAITLDGYAREDSLLSYSGQVDPVTGRRWGAVLETRLGISHYIATGAHEGVSIALDRAWQRGNDVQSNDSYGLRAGYSRDYQREGWSYLRVGPFLSWTAYRRNLSHFTFGHGGYYSPERDLRAGLQFDALTSGDRDRIARIQGALAWSDAREAAAPRFPGHLPGGDGYAASRNSGLAGDVRIRAGWLAGPRTIVNIHVGVASAPGFDRWSVGVGLKIPFERRYRLRPDDLYNVFDSRY